MLLSETGTPGIKNFKHFPNNKKANYDLKVSFQPFKIRRDYWLLVNNNTSHSLVVCTSHESEINRHQCFP